MGIGLIAAYLTHKLRSRRDENETARARTELHFGDLPPSPFLIPKANKRGASDEETSSL